MNRRKKVLIIGSDPSVKGGITSVINSFLENNWKDIEVELLSTYIEGTAFKKIVFFIKAICKYLIKIYKKEFEIVHVHMSYKGSFVRKFIISKISKMFNKKMILHLHGSEFEVFYENSSWVTKQCIRNMFENCEHVIVLGENWKNIVQRIAPKSSIHVFNNAVKIPEYKVEIDVNKINILFLGVLIKRKGIYELLEAIKILQENEFFNQYNVEFLIGGTGVEEEKIIQTINDYGIDKHVKMLGWINSELKEDILKQSNLLVLPSYNEGLPMAILEAMSYGIPVVATDVGSIAEVVNESNGCLIKPKSANEIVAGINTIFKNLDKWNKYSENARKDIVEKYNEKEYFIKIESLYNKMFL